MENKIRYQFERLPMVLFLACLAIAVVAGSDVSEDKNTKIFKLNKPIVLSCNSTNNPEIIWSKIVKEKEDEPEKSVEIKKIPHLKGRYSIKEKEGTFVIEKGLEEDLGSYTCSFKSNVLQTFNVFAAVIVKIPENLYAIEEEKVEITCIVKGSNPEISWKYRENMTDSDIDIEYDDFKDHVSFVEVDGIKNARLVIDKVKLSHRGYYTCIGQNTAMGVEVKSEGFLRIKDKLAALWPFLGIVAEVFVLCAIIFIYENRRNKTDLDESDTDQSPDQKTEQDAR